MRIVVEVRDAQCVAFGSMPIFHAHKGIAVAPAVEKTEAHGFEIVVGIEVPFALFRDAGIFSLHGREF